MNEREIKERIETLAHDAVYTADVMAQQGDGAAHEYDLDAQALEAALGWLKERDEAWAALEREREALVSARVDARAYEQQWVDAAHARDGARAALERVKRLRRYEMDGDGSGYGPGAVNAAPADDGDWVAIDDLQAAIGGEHGK